jgi:hypothetical protein
MNLSAPNLAMQHFEGRAFSIIPAACQHLHFIDVQGDEVGMFFAIVAAEAASKPTTNQIRQRERNCPLDNVSLAKS